MEMRKKLKLEILEQLRLNKKGFSYLEALLTLAIFGVSSAAVLSLVSNSFFISYNSDILLSANFLALKRLEEAKYQIYYNFATGTTGTDFWWLKNINTNPGGSFLGYTNFRTILEIETSSAATRTATITSLVYIEGKNEPLLKLIQEVYCWHPVKCF
jgi:type II secretory pathway pseudopilin PulG